MRRFRFFTERKNLRPGSSVKLPDFEATHIRKSLRLQKGAEVYLFNGVKEFQAVLTLVSHDVVMAKIMSVETNLSISDKEEINLTLFQALTKAPSFELVLEKSTELGVDQIVPFESEYSVVKTEKVLKKTERWNKIVLSSCKQSERVEIPEVLESTNFQEIFQLAKDQEIEDLIIFTLPRSNTKDLINLNSIKEVLKNIKSSKVGIVIGPEGGFSPGELKYAAEIKNMNIHFSILSKNVLKSETAAIAALAVVRFWFE
jgi:16S rRNA (uracil1498-N3)-methyltransferase